MFVVSRFTAEVLGKRFLLFNLFLFVEQFVNVLHFVCGARNTRRIVQTFHAVVVTFVAIKIGAARLPQQMSGVNAPSVSAKMTCFVLFTQRQFSVGKQHNLRVRQTVVVRVFSRWFGGVFERSIWTAGIGLNKCDDAAVFSEARGSVVQFFHPFLQEFVFWFVFANAFVQEKFLSIRRILSGIRSLGHYASEELVEFLRDRFKDLQIPFEFLVRQDGVRYSFLNYNFLFRRFFDLYGVSHYGVEFVSDPPLCTLY